jgi:hypothetical protein
MHENRYLHQVLKSRDYGVFQEDVRPLLGLPILDGTPQQLGVAGAAAADTALSPADVAASCQPLDKRPCTGLQGGTELLRADADRHQADQDSEDQADQDSEDGFWDLW